MTYLIIYILLYYFPASFLKFLEIAFWNCIGRKTQYFHKISKSKHIYSEPKNRIEPKNEIWFRSESYQISKQILYF